MWQVIWLQIKRNKIFASIWLLFFLLAATGSGSGSLMILFSWFFLYRLNVEEKKMRSSEFFNSLPLKFYEKAVIKIALPFLIVMAAGLVGIEYSFNYYLVSGGFASDLSSAALLTFASIVTTSLGSYILLGLGLNILIGIISFVPYVSVLATLVLLALSILFLSKHRLDSSKYVSIAGGVAIVIMIIISISRNEFLHLVMKTGDKRSSMFSAKILMNDGSQKAIIHLGDQLQNKPDSWTLQMVLDSFEGADKALPLDEGKWKILIQNNPDHREEIIEHLRRKRKMYSWINHDSMADVEDMVLTGDDACEDECHDLARLVASLDVINLSRVEKYLDSGRNQQILYAMEIIEHSNRRLFEKRLITLMDSDSKKIRKYAITILMKWVKKSQKDQLEQMYDNADESFDKNRMQKFKDYIQKSL